MVYIILSKDDSLNRKNIIEFTKQKIKFNNFNYHMVYVEQHIFENKLNFINHTKDIVLWEPKVAYNNLEILKQFQNSIVILDKPTLYVQKISEFNYINENTAINNGFYLVYINPNNKDITNDEWKLVVKEEMYLMNHEQLINLISNDLENIKTEKLHNSDVFDTIIDFTKNQINLSE